MCNNNQKNEKVLIFTVSVCIGFLLYLTAFHNERNEKNKVKAAYENHLKQCKYKSNE